VGRIEETREGEGRTETDNGLTALRNEAGSVDREREEQKERVRTDADDSREGASGS
jgi:hypothetical protein